MPELSCLSKLLSTFEKLKNKESKSQTGSGENADQSGQFHAIDTSEFSLEALTERNPEFIVLSSFYYTRYLWDNSNREDIPLPEVNRYFRHLLDGTAGYQIVKKFEKPESVMQIYYLDPVIVVLKKTDTSG